MKNILLIEDEEHIRKFVRINLEKNNFVVYEAASGEEGLLLLEKETIHIVILDIMLPNIDGYNVAKIIREKHPVIGIIMLTAKSQDVDKIIGLEAGTDDYMTKPFNPVELTLRVKSLARRLNDLSADTSSSILISQPFKMDKYSKKFFRNNIEIDLTPTEFLIMKLFIENPNKAFSREEILSIVWGYDFIGDSKIVDVNIRRLRSKIEDNPNSPDYIETVWGVGYRWISD